MQNKSFLIDTNVFISAFISGETKSTELFIRMIKDENIEIIADKILLKEYDSYAAKLGPKSEKFFQILSDSCIVVEPSDMQIETCREYFKDSEADLIHAASCLKQNSILLTNDKDFEDIKESELIEVWGITKAIKEIL